MEPHKVVSRDEWLAARKAHLANEKEFTTARDELSRQRRELPWVKVDKNYVFDGPNGKETLADLFGGTQPADRLSLHVRPGLGAGLPELLVPGRSFRRRRRASGAARRDLRRGLARAARRRSRRSSSAWAGASNGCRRSAATSIATIHVSFTKDELEKGEAYYNYAARQVPERGAPGASVFAKNAAGDVFHTYSTYGARPRHAGRRLPSSSTSRPRAATKTSSPWSPWPGCVTTTATTDAAVDRAAQYQQPKVRGIVLRLNRFEIHVALTQP